MIYAGYLHFRRTAGAVRFRLQRCWAVKLGSAPLKRANDPLHRIIEHKPDDALQDGIAKFEIDMKIDFAPAGNVAERPG